MTTEYVVIVYPAPPATRGAQAASIQSAGLPKLGPQVKIVRDATSPQHAASVAGVPAGGHALAAKLADMKRFDRAATAPLEEREPDGSPLPQEEGAPR